MYFYWCSKEALIPQRWSPNLSICIVLYVLHKNIAISIMRVSSISRILHFHLQLNFQISRMKHFSPLISSVVNIMLSKELANTSYVLLQKKNTNFTSQDNHQPLYPLLLDKMLNPSVHHLYPTNSLLPLPYLLKSMKARICVNTQELVQTPNKKLRLDCFYSNLFKCRTRVNETQ